MYISIRISSTLVAQGDLLVQPVSKQALVITFPRLKDPEVGLLGSPEILLSLGIFNYRLFPVRTTLSQLGQCKVACYLEKTSSAWCSPLPDLSLLLITSI